jgi:NADH:ubiquinone oxidoreductase subunit 6 (subunit J)
LWLAGASALVALEMYLLGAPEVAVIELSVGAGLVTVLFVFAINIAGEEAMSALPVVPKPLAWVLVAVFVLALGWLTLDILWMHVPVLEPLYFKTVLWENRLLDVLLQIVLMFAGVLGVLGLLAEIHPSTHETAGPGADGPVERREG